MFTWDQGLHCIDLQIIVELVDMQESFIWEPYKALLYVDKLRDYLQVNALKTLIPSEHK